MSDDAKELLFMLAACAAMSVLFGISVGAAMWWLGVVQCAR